ncbi:hypothetical protein AB4Y32_12990 [Paraburkholderia phymatum]|uniref:Uncharacterized protein n=1 Tax=Paraburkholderia phymatum TaxID=148447 RepID=A0ACC6TZD1_9BURK
MRALRFFAYFFILSRYIGQAVGGEFNMQCPQSNPRANIFDASRLSDDSRIAIEKRSGDDPVILAFYRQNQAGCSRSVFARYSIEGGEPFVESLFFYRIDGKVNVLVIVSWQINNRGEETYGKLYQIYAYYIKFDGSIVENSLVSDDDHMTGIDGVEQGQESKFQYKTAAGVKRYLKNKKYVAP